MKISPYSLTSCGSGPVFDTAVVAAFEHRDSDATHSSGTSAFERALLPLASAAVVWCLSYRTHSFLRESGARVCLPRARSWLYFRHGAEEAQLFGIGIPRCSRFALEFKGWRRLTGQGELTTMPLFAILPPMVRSLLRLWTHDELMGVYSKASVCATLPSSP